MFSISTVRLFRQSIPNAIFAEKIWENRFSSALLFFSFGLSLSVLFAVHGSIFVYHCYSPFSPITFSHWKEISLFVYLYGAWAFDFFPFYTAKVCVYYVCVCERVSRKREKSSKESENVIDTRIHTRISCSTHHFIFCSSIVSLPIEKGLLKSNLK